MKNTTIYFLFIICICLGFSYTAIAAFPVKNNTAALTVQKTGTDLATSMTQNNQIDPTPKLIRPAHELEDILSISAFGLGVIALILSIFNGVGVIIGILAIGLGIASMHMDGHKKLATLGFALGVCAVVIGLILAIVTF
jgi:hypothetical protein